jgi:hypothetical protein
LEEGRRAAVMESTDAEREDVMNSMREALSRASNGNDTLVAQLATLQVHARTNTHKNVQIYIYIYIYIYIHTYIHEFNEGGAQQGL